MRTRWTFGFVAVALLVLFAGGAFASCCHSDADLDCSDHVCKCATVQVNSVEFSPTAVGVAADRAGFVTQVAVTDIFRPPNTRS